MTLSAGCSAGEEICENCLVVSAETDVILGSDSIIAGNVTACGKAADRRRISGSKRRESEARGAEGAADRGRGGRRTANRRCGGAAVRRPARRWRDAIRRNGVSTSLS
jgi:hypothetical protein